MTYINWSDPDEMLGLLSEYIADEKADIQSDDARKEFLEALSMDLTELVNEVDELPSHQLAERLRSLYESQPGEFAGDPVLVHFQACLEEMERIRLERIG